MTTIEDTIKWIATLERRLSILETLESGGYRLADPFLALPQLRGFWPMSSVNESNNPIDLSGQARTLTNTASTPYGVYNNCVPYASFNGTTQYFTRADEAGLDVTGNLTVGGWVYFNTIAGSARVLVSKAGAAGNISFALYSSSAGVPTAYVSVDGTALTTVTHGTTLSTGIWYFLCARLTVSTSLDIYLNSVKATNTTAIPASIFNSTAAFTVGAVAGGGSYLYGVATSIFYCNTALTDTLLDSLFAATRVAFGV